MGIPWWPWRWSTSENMVALSFSCPHTDKRMGGIPCHLTENKSVSWNEVFSEDNVCPIGWGSKVWKVWVKWIQVSFFNGTFRAMLKHNEITEKHEYGVSQTNLSNVRFVFTVLCPGKGYRHCRKILLGRRRNWANEPGILQYLIKTDRHLSEKLPGSLHHWLILLAINNSSSLQRLRQQE